MNRQEFGLVACEGATTSEEVSIDGQIDAAGKGRRGVREGRREGRRLCHSDALARAASNEARAESLVG